MKKLWKNIRNKGKNLKKKTGKKWLKRAKRKINKRQAKSHCSFFFFRFPIFLGICFSHNDNTSVAVEIRTKRTRIRRLLERPRFLQNPVADHRFKTHPAFGHNFINCQGELIFQFKLQSTIVVSGCIFGVWCIDRFEIDWSRSAEGEACAVGDSASPSPNSITVIAIEMDVRHKPNECLFDGLSVPNCFRYCHGAVCLDYTRFCS